MSLGHDELVKCFKELPDDESELEHRDRLLAVVRRHGGEECVPPVGDDWSGVGPVKIHARLEGAAVAEARDGRIHVREALTP